MRKEKELEKPKGQAVGAAIGVPCNHPACTQRYEMKAERKKIKGINSQPKFQREERERIE